MTEKKVIETQYGWYQKNDNKVNVDEIIGIVKTDEQTNSVQLKKEAQLSICEKRVLELEKENEQLEKRLQIYKSDGLETLEKLQRCYNNSKKAMKTIDALYEENEQLKSFVKQLTNNCGEIVLMNGMAYNVKKALGDLE